MPFIAEDGTGLANANSLATVEFADNYHAERGNTAWTALSLERKQQLLIKATDYFVGLYGGLIKGSIAFAGQALPFPRLVNSLNVGIPLHILQAISELALVANTNDLLPNTTKRGKKRVKVGPIEVEYDAVGDTGGKFIAATVKIMPWLIRGASNPNQARLIRV